MGNLFTYVMEILAMAVLGATIIIGCVLIVLISKSIYDDYKERNNADIPNFMRK